MVVTEINVKSNQACCWLPISLDIDGLHGFNGIYVTCVLRFGVDATSWGVVQVLTELAKWRAPLD